MEPRLKSSIKRKLRRRHGRQAYDLLDEAAHLIRSAPLATHLWYAAGSVPFVLGLLYFWADMSRSAYAARHAGMAALGVALLFTWMKAAQSIFCARLMAQAAGADAPRIGWKGLMRVWVEQSIIQPWGILVLAVAAAFTFPLPWAMALYQNATVLGAWENASRESSVMARAWRQTKMWPGQLVTALSLLSMFGLFILLNIGLMIYLTPQMIKMLFGIESVFTSSGFSMLNTTFLAALMGLTYLCFDPYVKAVFVLRCFYGDAVKTGDDLRAELRSAAAAGELVRRAAMILLLGVSALIPLGTAARNAGQTDAPSGKVSSVTPVSLDEALREVIEERRYTWRMPREDFSTDSINDEEELGPVGKFFMWWRDMIRDTAQSTLRGIGKIFEWIEKLFPKRTTPTAPNLDFDFVSMALKGLMWLVVAVLVVAVVWIMARLIMQYRRQFRPATGIDAGAPPDAMPDLADESVSADQLPEDDWAVLARDLWERGERRLALRALYLGCLAVLARRELLRIARHKSNRDYERELQRRAHAFPEMMELFSMTMVGFERVWYGPHEATGEAFKDFREAFEKMARG